MRLKVSVMLMEPPASRSDSICNWQVYSKVPTELTGMSTTKDLVMFAEASTTSLGPSQVMLDKEMRFVGTPMAVPFSVRAVPVSTDSPDGTIDPPIDASTATAEVQNKGKNHINKNYQFSLITKPTS